jgi:hypothetical protein
MALKQERPANLFNLIRAIPRSACPTISSDLSSDTGGFDDRLHVSAAVIRGSMIASSSSIRSQIAVEFVFCFKVASRSITNCVDDVMAC